MLSAIRSVTWEDALHEYVLHLTATRAPKTVRFDKTQVTQLIKWANAEAVSFEEFGKRHMDRYLVQRLEEGKARTTLRADGVCAKKFFAWCVRNELLERNRLAEYEVHNAPKPPRHMPSGEEVTGLFQALREYWDPEKNKGVKFMPVPVRQFHRDRNTAMIMGLVDVGCRIGELVSLKVEDYNSKERKVVFRKTKGKEQRLVPVSVEWAEAMSVWLRLRAKVMFTVPKEQDEGWLFISDNGGVIDPLVFIKSLHRVTKWAGLPRLILHDLRRFSINKHVLINPFLTQEMVGHKDPKTTRGYTKLDVEDVRMMHNQAGLLKSVMSNKRPERRKKIV